MGESCWKLMKEYESGRKWVKMDESGWKGMKVDEMDENGWNGWKWMKANENGLSKNNANAWRSSPFQNIVSCFIYLFFSFLFIQIFPNWSRCYIPIFDGLVLIYLVILFALSFMKTLVCHFCIITNCQFQWLVSVNHVYF